MPWTKSFSKGLTARRGSIGHARLYEDEYASVVLGEGADASARVVGFVLGCADEKTFAAHLRKADKIEGYNPQGGGLYERAVVDVRLEDGETVAAYVYHRPDCKRSKRLWSGDWLKRHSAAEGKRPVQASDVASNHTADTSSSDDGDDSGDEHDTRSGGDDADQDDKRVERPPALGANANAPVRLLAPLQPRVPSRPDSGRRGAVQFGHSTSAATQKLRAARLAATAVANARSAPPEPRYASSTRASATRAPPPSSDGYSSSESYVCSLGAPLLFTAPHGLKLKRGTGPSQSARNHAREQYTSELVLKLSAKFAEHRLAQAAVTPSSSASAEVVAAPLASFMVWNYKTAAVDDPRNMDPNFLTRRTAVHSPWHSCLHAWKAANGFGSTERCPQLMHVDVHGKMDRAESMAIDVGMLPMEEEGCLEPRAVELIRSRLAKELRAAFKGRSAVSSKSGRNIAITVEEDPVLHGYWGEDTMMTMSHQGALLGATAVQFELPNAVRKLLMADGALFDAFATAIFNTYEALVSTGVAEQSRPGWEDDGDTGRYLKNLGTARQPLKELAVTPMLGTEGVAAMLRDLERAEMGSVHGKSI